MLSSKPVQPKITPTKLEIFLKEFAQPPVHNQTSLKSAEKEFDIDQSPVVAEPNVLENEDKILNSLNLTGSTTEKSLDYFMGDIQSKRISSKSSTSKRKISNKRKVTSKSSSKSVRSQCSNTLVSSPESRKCWFNYLKKTKTTKNNSIKKNNSSRTLESISISIVSSFSDRNTVSSNYEIVDISDEEPTTDWEKIRWMFGTENEPPFETTNPNQFKHNKTRQITPSKEDTYNSPLFKGLDFIKEYSKEYNEKVDKIKHGCSERRRKTSSCSSKSKSMGQKYKDYSGDFRKTLTKSCTRRSINRHKSVSEKSFTRKSTCRIIKSTQKTQFSQKTYSRVSNTKIYNSGKTTITDYFTKRKLNHRDRENYDHSPKSKQTVSNVFDKDYILSLDSKQRAKQFNFNENINEIVEDNTSVQNAKQVRNVNDVLTKTQNKLFSSEGFFESLSNESPIQDAIKNTRSCHKLTETLPETNIVVTNKREQSPEYYVMKITGSESKELIEKILNSNENAQVASMPFKKKEGNLKLTNAEVGTEAILKNTLSDPLSFGSQILTYSGNAKRNIDGDVKENVDGQTKLGTNKLIQSLFAKNSQALVGNSPSSSNFHKESLVTNTSTPSKPGSSQLTQTKTKKRNLFKDNLHTKLCESNNGSLPSLTKKQNSKNSQEFKLSQITSQNVHKCIKNSKDADLSQVKRGTGDSQDILDLLNSSSSFTPIFIKDNNFKENSLQKVHKSYNLSSQSLKNKRNSENSQAPILSQNHQKPIKTLRNTDLSQIQSNIDNISKLKSSCNNQDILDQLNKNSLISPIVKTNILMEMSQNLNTFDIHSQSTSQIQNSRVNLSELKTTGNTQGILDQLNGNTTVSPIFMKETHLKENLLPKLHVNNNSSSQGLRKKQNLKNSQEIPVSHNYHKSLKTLKNTDHSQMQSSTANASELKHSNINQDVLDQLNKNSLISPTHTKSNKLEDISQNIKISKKKSQSQNTTENPFFENLLTQNFLNFLNENCEEQRVSTGQSKRKDTVKLRTNKETENKQIPESRNNENSEIETGGECCSQTNFEYFKKLVDAHTESPLTESENPSQCVNKKSRKTYNITRDCILHEDNLFKSLLEDKKNSQRNPRITVLKRKSCEEVVENNTKAYIKRYKKGNTKIFKIKKRKKINDKEDYEPPEGQIMDRFLEKATNNFLDETRSDLIDYRDDSSISTPTSYITDETKSECLSTGSSKLAQPQQLLRRGINKLSKDKSLLFVSSIDTLPKEFNKDEILENIDQILSNVLEDFNQGRAAVFKMPKEHITNCVFRDQRFQIKDPPEYTTVPYKLAARRPKFNLILFLLNKIKMLLESDTKLTKREIYYQLKTMINSQSTTDQALKDVSRMLNVGLWALNIIAQKGLVYGNLKLVMADGETINCNVPGTLIPQDISKICEVHSTTYFILVVEKESIFHKLLEENLPNRLTRPFILITGKGFPDLNTQLFLKKLWMIMSVPVFILVDADPDGIAIMLNYRFGSIANAHVSKHLAIPKARWVGVFPSEILKLSLSYENLSKREISKTQTLLQLPCVHENEKIKWQLEKLLENGIKTGIEGLVKTDTYLSNFYLNWKFYTNDLI